MRKCKHEDGWLVSLPNEYILLNEEIEVKVSCNNMNCKKEKLIKITLKEINT